MAECKYKGCNEKVFESFDYCILHVELPENEESEEFERLNKLKSEKIQKKIRENDFNFRGAKLYEINFDNLKIDAPKNITLNFFKSKIKKNVSFTKSLVCGDIIFNKADIKGNILFRNNLITGRISFQNTCSKHVNFSENEILSFIFFKDATISGNLIFKETKTFQLDFSGAKQIKKVEFENIEVYRSISFMKSHISEEVWFENVNINHDLSFQNSKIDGYIFFKKIKILGSLRFDLATIDGSISFTEKGYIGKNAIFLGIKKVIDIRIEGIKIKGHLNLANTNIIRNALLDGATIDGNVDFDRANAGYNISFDSAKIGGHVRFIRSEIGQDLRFNNARIDGKVCLHTTKIDGNLYCKNTEFLMPEAQEEMSRVAKIRNDNLGNKIESDNYFYREMEAKREQKVWYYRYPEIAIQYGFGYGVHPWRVMITWLSIILTFAVIYLTQNWNYSDFLSYLYSSVVTAITPGFGNYRPQGIYQLVASFEAIIGTFMWAALIATFTRKYMR